jgi:hypothetical protein
VYSHSVNATAAVVIAVRDSVGQVSWGAYWVQ